MKFSTIVLILITTLGSVLPQDKKVFIKDGYYKAPSAGRVTLFYQVQGDKIAFFRSHAGHYAAFGKYNIIPEDSLLIIDYKRTIVSKQFADIDPFVRDTIGLIINDQKEATLFGLRHVDTESEEFYKNFSKLIKQKSKRIR